MEAIKKQIQGLPQKTGVYLFKDGLGQILYIGRAKNIKKRVASHFQGRGGVFADRMIEKVAEIEFVGTRSEKNARVLEQQFIRRYKPRFNIEWQDDKNFFWAGITEEDFPRIFLTHQKNKKQVGRPQKSVYLGPFVSGREIKSLLENLRKIFPFRTCRILPQSKCLYFDLGLCSAPCIHKEQKKNYQKMIFATKTILEIYLNKAKRIEGYDISNISGTEAAGAMVVFEKGKPKKSEYRKFNIKNVKGQNDVACLKEVIFRRLKHKEWKTPDLILIDGGRGQLSSVKGIKIPAVALAKDKASQGKFMTSYSKKTLLAEDLPQDLKNLFLQVRDEAHRFAITFHKSKRGKKIFY